MALPGINNFMNQIYQNNNKNQNTQKAKQDNKANNNKKSRTDAYGESAKYTKSKETNKLEQKEIDPLSRTTQSVELSDKAKDYLEKLREKYKDMDIMVANYGTDEEAEEHLSRGKGTINVLIDVELLEQMATDETIRSQYESVLDNAEGTFESIKEELGEDAQYVKSVGITIDKNGKTEYYSIIDQSLAKRANDKKDSAKETENSKKEKTKNKDNKYEKEKSSLTKVKADNLEDLFSKIKDAIANAKNLSEDKQTTVPSFDVTI